MDISEEKLNELRALYYKGLSYCYVNVEQNDREAALTHLNAAAQENYADAYYAIGDIYLYGFMGEQEAQEAFDAYLKGHNLGSAKCSYGIASIAEGEESAALAIKVFDKLFEEAQQGDEISQYIVAAYFANGLGCQAVNLSAYFYWLKESALSGCIYAMQEVGDCYRDGYCAPQSLSTANEWYVKSGLPPIAELPQKTEKHSSRHVVLMPQGEEDSAVEKQEEENKDSITQSLQDEEHSDNNKIYNAFGERSQYEGGQEQGENSSAKNDEAAQPQSEESKEGLQQDVFTEQREEGQFLNEEHAPRQSLEEKEEEEKDFARENEYGEDSYDNFENDGNNEDDRAQREKESSFKQIIEDTSLKERWQEEDSEYGFQKDNLPAGEEVERSPIELLFLRANLGEADAQTELALIYERGEGVPQNYDEAVRWYQSAAELEDAHAQNNLGVYYEKGIVVERNPFKAASLYKKASLQEYAPAKYNLAICHIEGIGVKKSYVEAARLLEEASNMNYAPAQYILGILYQSGKGVVRNLYKAAELYLDAYTGGIQDALARRELCLTLMEKEDRY